MPPTFEPFSKIPRLSRDIIITEKIDGTNASILVADDGEVFAASRTRWITPEDDNFGFARWVKEHENDLRTELGFGHHFGEWFGSGIQRGYGLKEKRFALFNTHRWGDVQLNLCHVVPVLYTGEFTTGAINEVLAGLDATGSRANPGFMNPEGVVIYHTASRTMFKKTLGNDGAKGNG